MDFPAFHLDFFGNRMLIAVIGIIHVVINHGLAIGMIPIVTTMEYFGFKNKDKKWDNLAYKILFVCFVITTTAGALTGVGIWFSVSLINPYSIGSLIRVFFWAWVTEWVVFVIEICLIMTYFLTWKNAVSEQQKKRHILIGVGLSLFSWITMAIIVAILGFMMDPSNWLTSHTLINGLLNRIYVPQLCFRTTLSMLNAGTIAMFLTILFTRRDHDFRAQILRFLGLWILFWATLVIPSGYWYYTRVPSSMVEHIPVSLLTSGFATWLDALLVGIAVCIVAVFMIAQVAIFRPKLIPAFLAIIPSLLLIGLTGHFERIREFIRKPYVIGRYMYANGIRVEDYNLLQKDGISSHMTYNHHLSESEKLNLDLSVFEKIEKGKNVFVVTCSRCHTIGGINSLVDKFDKTIGKEVKWEVEDLINYIETIHSVQSYMPPFPGNRMDAENMAYYVNHVRKNGKIMEGAQNVGISKNNNVSK